MNAADRAREAAEIADPTVLVTMPRGVLVAALSGDTDAVTAAWATAAGLVDGTLLRMSEGGRAPGFARIVDDLGGAVLDDRGDG